MYKKIVPIISAIILISILFILKDIFLYKAAMVYCKTKHLRAASEFVSCHYEFMAKFDKSLAQNYLDTRDECYLNYREEYETSVCVDYRMTRLK